MITDDTSIFIDLPQKSFAQIDSGMLEDVKMSRYACENESRKIFHTIQKIGEELLEDISKKCPKKR